MYRIIILTIIIGLIDSAKLLNTDYITKLSELSSKKLMYLVSIWFTLALLIVILIMDRIDYSIISIFKNGPLLGFGIYWIFNAMNGLFSSLLFVELTTSNACK
jgi:hypothetical protein